jgi:LemA protein
MKNIGCVVLVVVLVVVLLLGGSLVALNNRLVALQEGISAAWAQVETVLQRRYDLIPNLVNTVKGYAEHEKELFEEVARLRSQWAGARSVGEKVEAASQLEGRIGRLLLVAEQYPQLKASESFRDLQHELAGTENRIAVERQRYNEAIRAYNVAVRQFPGSLVAAFRGFAPSDAYFEAADAAQEVPAVDFRREEAP